MVGDNLIRSGTHAAEIYGRDEVFERYFDNYEVNPNYRESLEAAGLVLSGFSGTGDVRIAELPGHPLIAALNARCDERAALTAGAN